MVSFTVMVLEPDTGRCASEEAEPRRGVDTRWCASKDVGPRRGWIGDPASVGEGNYEDAGHRRGWIVRLHIGWGGERSILYKSVETPT